MRDRLVELMYKTNEVFANVDCTDEEAIVLLADYLLERGVIVPPCKVEDKVYQTVLFKDKAGFIVERKVVGFHLGEFPELRGSKRKQYFIVHHDATNAITHIDIDQLGKTVFLTREEAEAKLKEGGQG